MSKQRPYQEFDKDRAQARKALIGSYAEKVIAQADANGGSCCHAMSEVPLGEEGKDDKIAPPQCCHGPWWGWHCLSLSSCSFPPSPPTSSVSPYSRPPLSRQVVAISFAILAISSSSISLRYGRLGKLPRGSNCSTMRTALLCPSPASVPEAGIILEPADRAIALCQKLSGHFFLKFGFFFLAPSITSYPNKITFSS